MTKEEAKITLANLKRYMSGGGVVDKSVNKAIDMAIEALSQPEPHWIPVTERLPEDNVYVLLTIRRMDDSYNHVQFISTGYISWNHQCWWCAHDGNCKDANVEVLAWMPLPEPYKPTVPPECEGDCGWCKPSVIEKCKGVTE